MLASFNENKKLSNEADINIQARLIILKQTLEEFIKLTLDPENACAAELENNSTALSLQKIDETIAAYESWSWWIAYFVGDRANYQKALERRTSHALEVLFPSEGSQVSQKLTEQQIGSPIAVNTANLSDLMKIRLLENLLAAEDTQNSWQQWWDRDLRLAVKNQLQIQYVISVFSFLINPASETLPAHEIEKLDQKLKKIFDGYFNVSTYWSQENKTLVRKPLKHNNLMVLTHSGCLNQQKLLDSDVSSTFMGSLKFLSDLRAVKPVAPKIKTPDKKKQNNVRRTVSAINKPTDPESKDDLEIQPINFAFLSTTSICLSSFITNVSAFVELARVAVAVMFGSRVPSTPQVTSNSESPSVRDLTPYFKKSTINAVEESFCSSPESPV